MNKSSFLRRTKTAATFGLYSAITSVQLSSKGILVLSYPLSSFNSIRACSPGISFAFFPKTSCESKYSVQRSISTTKMNANIEDNNENINKNIMNVDPEYPGTAVLRLRAVHARVAQLAAANEFNGPWSEVRRRLLWAGGLRDITELPPGMGNTSHGFNDYNHVDLTTMNDDSAFRTNNNGKNYVKQIAVGNQLGTGIVAASLTELGPGGSWTTCANGCNASPAPRDVAHMQFRSRIAFKLVWEPATHYSTFVLLDDDGNLLARGTPTGENLPSMIQRQRNYQLVMGSKYATNVNV